MISIIVCSAKEEVYETFLKSLEESIGSVHEVIRVYNPNGELSICKAYNQSAAKAQYSYLCFIHEDVTFQTQNWGALLVAHFKQLANPGVIGVAGAVYKPKILTTWWQQEINGFEPKRVRLVQNFKFMEHPPHYTYHNPLNESSSEVVGLDGFFLSMTKQTWQDCLFDETLLKGFHGYDLDICLSVRATKRNYTVFDILLDHFSEGRNDESWLQDYFRLHEKHKQALPTAVEPYLKQVLHNPIIDLFWKHYWLRQFISWKIPFSSVFNYYQKLLQLNDEEVSSWQIKSTIAQAYSAFYWEQMSACLKTKALAWKHALAKRIKPYFKK